MEQTLNPTSFTYRNHRGAGIRAGASKREASASTSACYQISRSGRFWEVRDALGDLVCLTAYKKGAIEVVRRLSDKPVTGGTQAL